MILIRLAYLKESRVLYGRKRVPNAAFVYDILLLNCSKISNGNKYIYIIIIIPE